MEFKAHHIASSHPAGDRKPSPQNANMWLKVSVLVRPRLDDSSVGPSQVKTARTVTQSIRIIEARKIALKVLSMDLAANVRVFSKTFRSATS
ncbi:MAG: hypothetical protein WED04_10740 [Promethearchaeati archaeon SRVP18_Atabeyarchaeia-1]